MAIITADSTATADSDVITADGYSGAYCTPSFIAATTAVSDPTLSPGPVLISVGLISGTTQAYAPAASPGPVSRTADYLAPATSLPVPVLSGGLVSRTADYLAPTTALPAPTLSAGPVSRTADYLAPATALPDPGAAPGLVSLEPGYLGQATELYEPAPWEGPVTLGADRVPESGALYDLSLSPGPVSRSVELIDSPPTLNVPVLTSQASIGYLAPSTQVFELDKWTRVMLLEDITVQTIPQSFPIRTPQNGIIVADSIVTPEISDISRASTLEVDDIALSTGFAPCQSVGIISSGGTSLLSSGGGGLYSPGGGTALSTGKGSSILSSGGSSILGSGGSSALSVGVDCPPCIPEEPDPEEEVPYASRVDFVSDTELYRAEAEPGTSESSAGWRIRHSVIAAEDDVTTTWANGPAAFTHAWDQRERCPYTGV